MFRVLFRVRTYVYTDSDRRLHQFHNRLFVVQKTGRRVVLWQGWMDSFSDTLDATAGIDTNSDSTTTATSDAIPYNFPNILRPDNV